MTLRDLSTGGETETSGGSAVSGLPSFWDSADAAPKTEWEEWWDLFMTAANAKYSISVNEMLRTVTQQQQPRIAALINNLNDEAAERKIVSVLFLSLGSAATKSVTDKYPEMRVATESLIMETFIKNMNSKMFQQKLCTEPKRQSTTCIQICSCLRRRK